MIGIAPPRRKDRSCYRGVRLSMECLEDRCTPSVAYLVNTTDDTSDANIGDGLAQDANGNTSLRAAIEEGNEQSSLGAAAVMINFNLAAASKIVLTSELPWLSGNYLVTGNQGPEAQRIVIARNIIGDDPPKFRIFTIEDGYSLLLGSLNLRDGHSVSNGGAVLASSATLAVENCSFLENRSSDIGGAIYARNLVGIDNSSSNPVPTTLAVSNSRFYKNVAPDGGAIGLTFSPTALKSNVSISSTHFSDNIANRQLSGEGGAIYIECESKADTQYMGAISISGSDIRDNFADRSGGGIFLKSVFNFEMSDTVIVDNVANVNGGGLYSDKTRIGSIWVSGVSISDNKSVFGSGGGVCIKDDGNENIKGAFANVLVLGNVSTDPVGTGVARSAKSLLGYTPVVGSQTIHVL